MAHAQADERGFFVELPTVLTVSRLPQSLEQAPGAVTVLDREQIRATGYRDIARLFRLVPGMQVGQERGNWNWVTYHGLGNNYPSEMQVLVDGRSVYSAASFGGVDWAALPLSIDEIECIEVVRGTNPVTYGSNAFLGAINIITRHSAENRGLRSQVSGGSVGVRDVRAEAGSVVGDLAMRLNLVSMHDEGFAGLHDHRDTRNLSWRGDYRASAADELMFRVAGGATAKGEGYPNSVFGNNAERDSLSRALSMHVQWTHAPSSDEELQLSVYRNREHTTDSWMAVAPPLPTILPGGALVPLNRDRTATRDHLELQHRLNPALNFKLVWGLETRRDVVEAPFLYAGGGPAPVILNRAFGNAEWRLAPGWQANLGLAVERYRGEPTHVAPRTFLNWQPTPEQAWRIGYARAWEQRPTFEKEGEVRAYDPATGQLLVHPYLPNPDLRQARVDSVELGYVGHWRQPAITMDVRVFRERIQGFVYREAVHSPLLPLLETQVDSTRYVNAGRAVLLTGIEYQIKGHPWRGGELIFNHALIKADTGGLSLDRRVAPYVASLSWQQRHGDGWTSQLTVLRMGPLAGSDGFSPIRSYVARPYTTVDARVAYAFSARGGKWELALNAINLGSRHQEIADSSEQAVAGSSPANRVAPTVFASLSAEF